MSLTTERVSSGKLAIPLLLISRNAAVPFVEVTTFSSLMTMGGNGQSLALAGEGTPWTKASCVILLLEWHLITLGRTERTGTRERVMEE